MTTTDAPHDLWEGDVNEAAIEEWKADTTTFDRIRHVSDVTTEPQAVSTIAERAHVSEPTARKYLSILAETGRVKIINTESGTRYMRAPQMLAMKRIAAIHREHTKSEIRDSIRDLKTELNSFREQYGVVDVDELSLKLEPGDNGWRDVTRWQQIEQNLEIAQAALSLYDFDPDDSHAAAARVADTRRVIGSDEYGALGDESEQSTA
ncbi:DNA-binding transcriptional regulator LsrR (DeoR family) [Halorubrum alkaliphilum]|uniref:DNA-binding transcriptional regulator LsrR (DeoR family) n=1 Tax=Halorubrum alkaliphilum TaxID=261290 RepID=A0A8T4GIS9_9EURY|nr:ArsR family transcriptional regulator [Halorubrum alkaliphilum]MBP1923639.1 DNA-binding transcriptional regulator LsrR (DeoR family) [Halorubrum alkaliphilum]